MSAQAEKKNKSIGEAIRAIHKQFGSGSIMRLDGSEVQPVDVIPTGSVALDVALGCGGLPRGRIIEIYGPESSGKTTLTLHAIAEAQRAGGVCAFIDAEHALDTDYARRLGVELEDLLVSQPDCGEQALEICAVSLRSAWLISRACRPMWASPMSPSISARGVRAATESTTIRSIAPVRTRVSVISSACSPQSGCETSRSSRSTPSRRA